MFFINSKIKQALKFKIYNTQKSKHNHQSKLQLIFPDIKPSLFMKTIAKQRIGPNVQENEQLKTRRTCFKSFKAQNNLSHIIRDLQKNVKELKNYHQSLQKSKPNSNPMKKSASVNQLNKIKFGKSKTASRMFRSIKKTIVSKKSQHKHILANKQAQQNAIPVESTISKYQHENASTMLSIHNADVDQVKKAYQNVYGKENTNIVDLYNFFRKNAQKSTRILHGSMQMQKTHQQQHQDELCKSNDLYQSNGSNVFMYPNRKKQPINIIIEGKQQLNKSKSSAHRIIHNQNKQQTEDIQNDSSIYRISLQRNPTIEQIFKNGCSDLANVYDFVKKRRVSLKNYLPTNKNKQNRNTLNIVEPSLKSLQKQISNKIQSVGKPAQTGKDYLIEQKSQINLIKFKVEQEPKRKNIISSPQMDSLRAVNAENSTGKMGSAHLRFFQEKSCKKSQKSSIKKSSKQKQVDLDRNILQQSINGFNELIIKQQESQNNDKIFDDDFYSSMIDKQQVNKKCQKFKLSKYYVAPVPMKKQSSLDGCSISVKSSSRIIELDFIPLDL